LAGAGESLRGLGAETVFGPGAESFPGEVDLVVLSPGIDGRERIVRQFTDRGVPVIGEIEFAFRHFPAPVVAITGTNGKTTTTEMVGEVMRAAGMRVACAGNYGVPFTEIVLRDEPQDAVALEVSSFQLETIERFRPKVAVFLNFAADHQDRYPSLEEYREAKMRIFENQEEGDVAVVQAALRDQVAPRCRARLVTFGVFEPGEYDYADGWIRRRGERILEFAATRLRGLHNAENLMAVLAVAAEWGIGPERVAEALREYRPPAHRCEWVGSVAGHECINDSKATNLHALESSLRGQLEPVVLIAGGKDKGLDFAEVTAALAGKVTHAVLIGETRERIRAAWGGAVPCSLAGTLGEAVEEALARARPRQTILFSPGTSSFDMFANYEDRGDCFRREVRRLEERAQTSAGAGAESG
jgi:UDP-N-acetylmuramoylalanine--D-glutamate ligase